jgi:hypothetical protein
MTVNEYGELIPPPRKRRIPLAAKWVAGIVAFFSFVSWYGGRYVEEKPSSNEAGSSSLVSTTTFYCDYACRQWVKAQSPTTLSVAPEPTVPPRTAATTPRTVRDPIDDYLSIAGSVFPAGETADYMEVGRLACEAVEIHGSVEAAEEYLYWNVVVPTGVDPTDAGLLISAAIETFCPEYFG